MAIPSRQKSPPLVPLGLHSLFVGFRAINPQSKKSTIQPFPKPENNALQTTYDFYACFLLGGNIKVTTGFPIGTSDTTHFFSPDTSSPGIHSKKCVVIESDNVEK